MAIATQDILAVKRKVFNYLKGGTKGDPLSFALLDQLFRYFSQHGANPDLQVVFYANLTADSIVADAACRVYAVYGRKQNTATDAYFKGNDSATVTSGSDDDINLEFLEALDSQVWVSKKGLPMANGFTIGSDTSANGTSATSTGDGPDGFVIIGAP